MSPDIFIITLFWITTALLLLVCLIQDNKRIDRDRSRAQTLARRFVNEILREGISIDRIYYRAVLLTSNMSPFTYKYIFLGEVQAEIDRLKQHP